MIKRWAILFVSLLLLANLAGAFHHHDDGADHPDCPTCIAYHQQSEPATSAPVCLVARSVAATVYLLPASTVILPTFFASANNRAPPA